MALKILIIEDNDFYAEMLEHFLSSNPDNRIFKARSGKEALDKLKENPDVITLDHSLPDMKGEDLLKKILQKLPGCKVIAISGQEDIKTAVNLLKEGAYEYIVKDDETKTRLWNTLNHILENRKLVREIDQLREEVGKKYDPGKSIIGKSKAITGIFDLIEKASKTNINVSITGETGTGKDLVAKAIHFSSPRKNQKFVAINVAAIPADLIESELFGHEKGAFTGAHERKEGKFKEADKGTLFLDEIGDLDKNLQAKLLRALQEKEITRVGGNEVIKFDARIIVASHKNLSDEVKKGTFREDLYYRLLGLPVELPPLRDRGDDRYILAEYFIDSFCKENKLKRPELTAESRERLSQHSFPGNIRELKAIMELAVVLCDGNKIIPSNLQFNRAGQGGNFLDNEMSLEEYNLTIIKTFLSRYDKNVGLVADKLQIGKSTIYRLLANERKGSHS